MRVQAATGEVFLAHEPGAEAEQWEVELVATDNWGHQARALLVLETLPSNRVPMWSEPRRLCHVSEDTAPGAAVCGETVARDPDGDVLR